MTVEEAGQKGGKAAGRMLTKKQRKERARKAAIAMHKKNGHQLKKE